MAHPELNKHEPECTAADDAPTPVDAGLTHITVEIDIVAGQHIIGHAINRANGDMLCFVGLQQDNPDYSVIGEFFAMVRDNFDKVLDS